MVSGTVGENDELMVALQVELEKTLTKQVCEAVYAIAAFPPAGYDSAKT